MSYPSTLSFLLLALCFSLKPAARLQAVIAQPEAVRVLQLVEGEPLRRFFPGALPSLLQAASEEIGVNFSPDPVFIERFDSPLLEQYPLLYVNYGDRRDWNLSPSEFENLASYLDRGGFLVIDAGITAEFLRGNATYGQHHSFAAWEVTPQLEDMARRLFPESEFQPLPRNHPIFQIFYSGLPDTGALPEAVREFVVNEKWPQGTYSILGLHVEGRLVAIATPILALGWGKNETGQWTNTIGFRIRESAEGLDEKLREATYSGIHYEVKREDGRYDRVYCQPETVPAWVEEPNGRWRVFRYYSTSEISDYAHVFYTQLGINILAFAMLQ